MISTPRSLRPPRPPCHDRRPRRIGRRRGDGRRRRAIVVQSMTNTDTADVEGTARQIAALARAGSEMVRITVDRDEAAAAVPHIRDLRAQRRHGPLVGDFHYIGHKLLAEHPACAEALDKYRINPGNVGFKNKRDVQFATSRREGDPVRQGGADRRQLGLARPGIADRTDGRQRQARRAARRARCDARGDGALGARFGGAGRRNRAGAGKIILSAKVSAVQDLITVYRMLAARSYYAIHLGLTEAGMGRRASSPRPLRSACCCRRASATRSASR